MTSFYLLSFFFFHGTPTTEIYTLSLHDALPISVRLQQPVDTASYRPRHHRQQKEKTLPRIRAGRHMMRSEEHTSELQSLRHLVCRLLLEKKKRTLWSCNGMKAGGEGCRRPALYP